LNAFLNTALASEGRIVFVVGGAGRGKTALMWEFARRAMDAHPELLIASGNCTAFSGFGDPYLPFREMMCVLTGSVEGLWASGVISREHAHRLWFALPLVVDTLMNRASLSPAKPASALGAARNRQYIYNAHSPRCVMHSTLPDGVL
jgi:hypothetical protein